MQKIESNQTTELNDRERDQALQVMTGILRVAGLCMRIFFLIGIGVTVLGVILLWKALSSQAWPSVKGRIISASLEKEKVGRREIFREQIQYVYHVEGKKFVGDRVSLTPRLATLGLPTRQMTNKYPKGALVTVYYNPSRPEESVLEPGFNANIILIATAGPFILLIVTILYRFLIRLESSARLKLELPGEKHIPSTAPIRSEAPDFEPTRKWIITLLTALLLVLLAIQFYGDEISKWFESIIKEDGFKIADK